MDNNYVYPARFIRRDGNFILDFYDFDIHIEEESMDELISSAQEQLALSIIDYLDCGKSLPAATDAPDGSLYIHIWLPYFRTQIKEIYVRKSVTIPQWLDILAKENDLNFSAALTYGIKAALGLNEK